MSGINNGNRASHIEYDRAVMDFYHELFWSISKGSRKLRFASELHDLDGHDVRAACAVLQACREERREKVLGFLLDEIREQRERVKDSGFRDSTEALLSEAHRLFCKPHKLKFGSKRDCRLLGLIAFHCDDGSTVTPAVELLKGARWYALGQQDGGDIEAGDEHFVRAAWKTVRFAFDETAEYQRDAATRASPRWTKAMQYAAESSQRIIAGLQPAEVAQAAE